MKIKTSELIGPALDWAVAKCEGVDYFGPAYKYLGEPYFRYSTDWSQGGPIIEREGIDTWCILVGKPTHPDSAWRKSSWNAKYCRMGFGTDAIHGPTPLIAAMRCYVASKLGDEVEIPEGLQ